MTYMKYSSVIETIDVIDDIKMESEMSVIKSFLKELNKTSVIMENCHEMNSFGFYQEAKTEKKSKKDTESSDDTVIGTVKKWSANDKNKALSVVAFIPRLIAAICSKIAKAVKEKVGKIFKKTGTDDAEESMEYKEKKVTVLNKIFEGKCETYLDQKDGKIKFKKSLNNLIHDLCWVLPAIATLTALLHEFNRWVDYSPTNIEKFAMRIEHACTHIKDVKLKDVWAILKDGIGALGNLLDDADVALLALDTALVAAKHKTDKELCKLQMNNNTDPEKELKVMKWNKLADSLLKLSTTMTVIIAPIVFFKKKAKDVSEAVDDLIDAKKWWKELSEQRKAAIWHVLFGIIKDDRGWSDEDETDFEKIYNDTRRKYTSIGKIKNESDKEYVYRSYIQFDIWATKINKNCIVFSKNILSRAKVPGENKCYFSDEMLKRIDGTKLNQINRTDELAIKKFYNKCYKVSAKANKGSGREDFKNSLGG